MQISFFEDEISNNFKPLTLTRPVWDLRIGILTILDKWKKSLDPEIILWGTNETLSEVFPSPKPDSTRTVIYINSRYLPSKELVDALEKLEPNNGIKDGEITIAYCVHKTDNQPNIQFTEIDFTPVQISYLWELFDLNKSQIEADINLMKLTSVEEKSIQNITITNPQHTYIANSATIEPGVIIMADQGPVYIGENAAIEAGAIIKGPTAICDEATVKMRARIYDGSTIGPVCKVGGEVSNTIFHSYSNKGHDGFVGNSIFGQWCNLGADTNTSNLKNNYSLVRINDWETKQVYDEGVQFLGTIMGDHSKTSINCMLNTGTVCGVSSNIFTSEFPPKYIPSFTWLDGKDNPEFKFEKALEVMKAMMARRKMEPTPEYETMMKEISDRR